MRITLCIILSLAIVFLLCLWLGNVEQAFIPAKRLIRDSFIKPSAKVELPPRRLLKIISLSFVLTESSLLISDGYYLVFIDNFKMVAAFLPYFIHQKVPNELTEVTELVKDDFNGTGSPFTKKLKHSTQSRLLL